MVSYSDSEVKIFHPLCERALNEALKAVGADKDYRVLHHQYTGTLEMDFVIQNKNTLQYLCVIEVKRTPSDVQSTRYQFQAMSYVQMNAAQNEQPFYIVTNLECLIGFRYDGAKPSPYQQMLEPGLMQVCDFKTDNEPVIVRLLSARFAGILRDFIMNSFTYMTTLDEFVTYMRRVLPDKRLWKSSLAVLLYEYIRGAFSMVGRSDISYDVRVFRGDVEDICKEARKVDFDGIFGFDPLKYHPACHISNALLSNIYDFGNKNVSGDFIANSLHEIVSAGNEHEGEVATDPELSRLVCVLAKMERGEPAPDKKICDPAAGSASIICSAIDVFHVQPGQLMANDGNKGFLELLSLRLGLKFPRSIAKSNAPIVSAEDLADLDKSYFKDVEIVLLNPPFVAGINSVYRRNVFYGKIKALTGAPAMTEKGQMNLGAVFLETVCHMVEPGTTIACIFPKAHLTARGVEAVTFRRFLLELFGLHIIFNYPAEELFETVTEETCIFVGRAGCKQDAISVFSSNDKVSDIDLYRLEKISVSSLSPVAFTTVIPGIEGRTMTYEQLEQAVEDGWRLVCSEMSEALAFTEKNITRNPKLDFLPNTTKRHKKGHAGVDGGSDLLFFDTLEELYNKYPSIPLAEGLRSAKYDKFVITSGDSKFLNLSLITVKQAEDIIEDYIPLQRAPEKQQRAFKSKVQWMNVLKNEAGYEFPANTVLAPTKIRRYGRVFVSRLPLFVSTNFATYTYGSVREAEIIASYMATVFYQLECEVSSKDHSGVRKSEVKDVKLSHVPIAEAVSAKQYKKIHAAVPKITFLDLNKPIKREIDEIWARILFEDKAEEVLEDAIRLLKFLANRRNPIVS